MSPLRAILRMRLLTLRNVFRNVKKDALAKTFVVFFGLGNIVGLGLWVSYMSFRFIEQFSFFGAALNAKMISLLFFALLILVSLSTIIVAYTTIFLARETGFFFQHPVPPRTVFLVKMGEAIIFSSWATLFLCFPVLVAFGLLRGASASYYLQAVAVLFLFLLFAALSGTTVAIGLAPVIRRLTRRQILAAGATALVGLGAVFLHSFRFWDMDGENDLLILDRFASQLSLLQSPFFPGYWAAAAVLAAAAGNQEEVLFHMSTLLANTLIFLPFLSWYAAKHYGRQWVVSRGSEAAIRRGEDENAAESGKWLSPSPLRALVFKDLLVFVRDPAQLSQSLLFIVLMVVYSLSLLRMPSYFTTLGGMKFTLYFANLGAVCMILSSFTARFLFPLLSLEGRAFWIVGLAPIPRALLLQQKAVFGLGVVLLLGLVTGLVSNLALGYSPAMVLAGLYTILLASICLTSLATGLGAAYPNFEEDNPARIAVGLGGTLNFFASALAVALLIAIEALPYLLSGGNPGLKWIAGSHLFALGFACALSAFCLKLGTQSLVRREF